jgi:peptidoglycan-associated lipoprotein
MGITKIRGFLVIGLAAWLLAGCASTEPEEAPVVEEPVEVVEVVEEAPKPVIIEPRVVRGKIEIPRGDMGDTEILQGIFYFDFDQAIVKRGGHTELNDHAKVLSGNRMFNIRLEGHADERGTREYNLALGERRANAVRAYLIAQGASRSQIEVISYGEEKPAKRGHSESSWAQNRRVEIVYR